jgi:hypothetical protein
MIESERNNQVGSVALILRKVMGALLPAVTAATLVYFEPTLSAWLVGRESVLPVAMILVLSAMVQPALRRVFVVALCYGVAFLALRDSQLRQPLPSLVNYSLLVEVRPAVLIMIAGLAMIAAVSETVHPGTVWARRCYFGAAALYFTGLGVISCAWGVTWQAVMLCVTGIAAIAAFLFADRLGADDEEVETIDSDDAAQQEREAAHARALRSKEWHDASDQTLSGDGQGTSRGSHTVPSS